MLHGPSVKFLVEEFQSVESILHLFPWLSASFPPSYALLRVLGTSVVTTGFSSTGDVFPRAETRGQTAGGLLPCNSEPVDAREKLFPWW